MKDYQKNIVVNQPVDKVYAAITRHIPDWWSDDYAGAAAHAGDHFDIAFGGTQKTFEILTAVPNEQVVWQCVKAYIDVPTLKNKAEWLGTKQVWTLSANGDSTTVTLLHEGLNPGMECYELCVSCWDAFLSSLDAYLATGKGTPYQKAAVAQTVE